MKIPTTIWGVLLLSVVKCVSGNRPYLLSVFRVNWQLQFQEVLFFSFGFTSYQTSGGLVVSKPPMQKESRRPSGTPPPSRPCVLSPSNGRPPPCHWERRSPWPRWSAPAAYERVRWGPASRSAGAGVPSWRCSSAPGCTPSPPRRSTSPRGRRGPGCVRPPAGPGTARRGSVGAGTALGLRRAASRPPPPPPPPGSSCWACPPASRSSRRRRPVCRRRRRRRRGAAGSRRCEGESGSAIRVVGRSGCWTRRWRAPGCPSCCPGDENKDERTFRESFFPRKQCTLETEGGISTCRCVVWLIWGLRPWLSESTHLLILGARSLGARRSRGLQTSFFWVAARGVRRKEVAALLGSAALPVALLPVLRAGH